MTNQWQFWSTCLFLDLAYSMMLAYHLIFDLDYIFNILLISTAMKMRLSGTYAEFAESQLLDCLYIWEKNPILFKLLLIMMSIKKKKKKREGEREREQKKRMIHKIFQVKSHINNSYKTICLITRNIISIKNKKWHVHWKSKEKRNIGI